MTLNNRCNSKKILLTFREGADGSGPFNSHKRILISQLASEFQFESLVIPKGKLGVFNFRLIKTLYTRIKEERPDLVHFSGLQLEGFYVSLACYICGVKSVCAVRGSSLEANDIGITKKIVLAIYEFASLLFSNMIYANSRYVSNWGRFNWFKHKFKGVIYNLPPSDRLRDNFLDKQKFRSLIRKQLKISDEALVFIYTGRVTKDKGADILFKLIESKVFSENVHLLILGSGPEYSRILELSIKSDVTCNVHMFEYIEDVIPYLLSADVFISCSKHETLGNSIIEAGFCELPVIAKRTGGIPEIVIDEESGLLVGTDSYKDYRGAITRLAESKNLRLVFGNNARKHVMKVFDHARIIEELRQIYSKC
ncbi:glycosyltransferase family 4 protein [Pseudidiomarina taiwanensis]|uniref:Glycosyl transferase family 1 domain-containing protein n=1 Tax=Pseudidiomarina taiwanensis TaxID=337250 RepID=A0A432ZKF8_9GAMM|nr:glycosyltransferase family 4 protein [Pseudidiomarina taiwanensis]RUO78393.1 hypothetical protein CWI83_05020 [Pseudidiomarina taiwanensis]